MSELTPCNYCTLNMIKKRAKKEGKKVVMLSANWGMGGTNVYIVPKDFSKDRIDQLKKNRKMDDRYFAAWLMQISDHCCC